MSCLWCFTVPFLIFLMRVPCLMAFSAYLCHEDCRNEYDDYCYLKFNRLYVPDRNDVNHVRETRQLNNHALPSLEENRNIERQFHPMQPRFRTFLKHGFPAGSVPSGLLERNPIRKFAELKHNKYGPTPAFDPQTLLEDLSMKALQKLKPSSFDPSTQKFASLKHTKVKPTKHPKPNNGDSFGNEQWLNFPDGPFGTRPPQIIPQAPPKTPTETPFHIPPKPQPMPPFHNPTYSPQSTNNMPLYPQADEKDTDNIPRFYLHFSLSEGGLATNEKQR